MSPWIQTLLNKPGVPSSSPLIWRATLLSALLGLIIASVPAIASQWWYVNSGPGRVLFVDAQSIERKKDIVDYWTMHVIRPGEPEVITKSHMRADCGKHRLMLLNILRYDEKGRAIGAALVAPVAGH